MQEGWTDLCPVIKRVDDNLASSIPTGIKDEQIVADPVDEAEIFVGKQSTTPSDQKLL